MKLMNLIGIVLAMAILISGTMAASSGPIELRPNANLTGSSTSYLKGFTNLVESDSLVTISVDGTAVVSKNYLGDVIATGVLGTNDLAIFNSTRDYCYAHYPLGATITVLNGAYNISTFQYTYSNLTLRLNKGVTISGSATLSDYPIKNWGFPSYTDNYGNRSMFWAQDVQNIALVGEGTLDGNGDKAAFNISSFQGRPYIIRFGNVSGFRVGEGLHVLNPAMWSQHYLNCSNGIIEDQYIRCMDRGWSTSRLNQNLDGIDVDCCDAVIVSKIDAITEDDAIVLKSTGPKNCTNITVTNCLLSSRSNAVKLGTESNGGFQNIIINNINIFDSYGGVGVSTVDGGQSKNIIVSNINEHNVGTPFWVRLGLRNTTYGHGSSVTKKSKMESVTFDNIYCSNQTSAAHPAFISGYEASNPGQIFAVTVKNFRVKLSPGGGTQAQSLAVIPEYVTNYPNCDMFGTLPAWGLYVRHVHTLYLNNVEAAYVTTNDDRANYVFHDVAIGKIDRLMTSKGTLSLARVFINGSSRLIVSGVSGSTGPIFRINGSATAKIDLIGNDIAGIVSTIGSEVTAAQVHSHVDEPIHIKATNSGTSCTSGAYVKIIFNVTAYDDSGGQWDTSRFTATNAGYYHVASYLSFVQYTGTNASNAISTYLYVYKNGLVNTALGSVAEDSQNTFWSLGGSTVVYLAAREYIELYIRRKGQTQNLMGATNAELTWVTITSV